MAGLHSARLASSGTLLAALGVLCSGFMTLAFGAESALSQLAAYERPRFPGELRAAQVTTGFATIAFEVASDGTIRDAVALEANHAAFAGAVFEVLPSWRFHAQTQGPSIRREVLRIEFSQTGVVASLSHREGLKTFFPVPEATKQIRTLLESDLVTPLVRDQTSTTQAGAPGRARISFVVDVEGRVRVPIVIDATDDQVAAQAIAAVRGWRYKPIIIDGVPVLVESARVITFAQ